MMTTTNERREEAAIAATVARRLWTGFTSNEKAGVRFGLFPAEKMKDAVQEIAGRDAHRLLAVALMDCAKADGGMRG